MDDLNIKIYRDSKGKVDISYIDTDELIYSYNSLDIVKYSERDVLGKILSERKEDYNQNNLEINQYIYDDNGVYVCSYSKQSMELLLYNQYGLEYKIKLWTNIS